MNMTREAEPVEVEAPGKHTDRACNDIRVYSGSSHLPELGIPIPVEEPVCWICLDSEQKGARLIKPCRCPRHAHAHCLARWQLQSAGSRRETHCEFCDSTLPDWKATLTPQCGANAPAVMNVNFDGRTYSFEVKPGVDGYRQFTEAIRRAFSLPDDSELNITFTCDEPITGTPEQPVIPSPPVYVPEVPSTPTSPSGSLLTLQGAGAYDAAVHCASVSAARRIMQQQGPNGSPRFAPAPGHPFRQQAEQRGMRLQGQVIQRPAAEDHSTLQRPFRFARRAIQKLRGGPSSKSERTD